MATSSGPEPGASERLAEALRVPTEVDQRIGRLVDRLGDAALDALVVTDLLNVRYLTGFTGGAATLVITPDRTTLVTDGRYGVLAEDTTSTGIFVEVTDDDGRAVITSAVGDSNRIGLEADEVSWRRLRTFTEDWFADARCGRRRGSSKSCAS